MTPYAATLVLRPEDDETREIARTQAGADGRFEFRVPPGDYVIWPLPGDPFPTAQQVPVTVVAGEFTEVQVNYDSGIR
ncbi:MAG TPA: hypothetical protein VFK38_11120 [Candidatus Limnocylindrales bacterium]|nr:hypothetical protein [Candidatus Limnocylindrales bacterium]